MMGDRIGIVFNTAAGDSDLYAQSHWGGRDLLVAAQSFIREKEPSFDADPDELIKEFVEWCTSKTWDPESIEIHSHREDGDYEDCEDNGVFTVSHEGMVW